MPRQKSLAAFGNLCYTASLAQAMKREAKSRTPDFRDTRRDVNHVVGPSSSSKTVACLLAASFEFAVALPPERGEDTKVAVDDLGNIYTAGAFSGTEDFDPGESTFNLTAVGNVDMFVAKFDSTGDFAWVKSIGGLAAQPKAITVDSLGNIYTTGLFFGTADFDPGPGVANLISVVLYAYAATFDSADFLTSRLCECQT